MSTHYYGSGRLVRRLRISVQFWAVDLVVTVTQPARKIVLRPDADEKKITLLACAWCASFAAFALDNAYGRRGGI